MPTQQDGGTSVRFKDKYFLILLLLFMVIANVALLRKVSSQEATILALKGGLSLKVGDHVPPIQGARPTGELATLDYSQSQMPIVLYVFTPQCPWCKKNIDNLHALAANSGKAYRLIGIALNDKDLIPYIQKEDLGFPVFTHLDANTIRSYHFSETPDTIVISTKGQVLKIWRGAYQANTKEDIAKYLGMSFPG